MNSNALKPEAYLNYLTTGSLPHIRQSPITQLRTYVLEELISQGTGRHMLECRVCCEGSSSSITAQIRKVKLSL
jgi:hypothetical protein